MQALTQLFNRVQHLGYLLATLEVRLGFLRQGVACWLRFIIRLFSYGGSGARTLSSFFDIMPEHLECILRLQLQANNLVHFCLPDHPPLLIIVRFHLLLVHHLLSAQIPFHLFLLASDSFCFVILLQQLLHLCHANIAHQPLEFLVVSNNANEMFPLVCRVLLQYVVILSVAEVRHTTQRLNLLLYVNQVFERGFRAAEFNFGTPYL